MHPVHQSRTLGARQHFEPIHKRDLTVSRFPPSGHELPRRLALALLLGMDCVRSRFGRKPKRAGDENRRARMPPPQSVHKSRQGLAVHLGRRIGPVVEHEGLRVDFRHRLSHGRLPKTRTTKTQVDEVEIQRPTQYGRVAQARIFGTASLRDTRTIKHHRPRPSHRRRRSQRGPWVQHQPFDAHRLIQRQVQRHLPHRASLAQSPLPLD